MAKKQAVSVSKFIADRNESIKSLRESNARIKKHANDFAMAFAAINAVARHAELDGKIWASADPEVWYRWNGDVELSVSAHIEMENVSSLKEGRVPATIAAAEKAGFEFDITQDYVSETYAQRSFKAIGNFNGVRVRLTLSASVADDAETCKRVYVGKEIKEVAKYEIVCE
jgi:hypothetical protein